MKFKGDADYKHDTPACTGVLITNLGTPDAANSRAVRRYLDEFLSDPRVIEVPRLVWWFVLNIIILNTRPRRSAKAYRKIWNDEGSPLLSISKKQAIAIQAKLKKQIPGPVKVVLAMRYGSPSIREGLEKLRQANAKRILIFPLYPQYSAATTASTFDAVADELKTWRYLPELRMINHYHDYPAYISALANSINQHWQTHEKPEKLLFSFHGLPKHYFLAGDPYHCECHKTARLVAEKLKLDKNDWMVTFQSRFGPREWLRPYTDETLKELGSKGVQHVQVISPGFSADCLETLEEIDMQNRDFFTEAGGLLYSYIPALNDNEEHIQLLTSLICRHTQGWVEFNPDWDSEKMHQALSQTHSLAEALINNPD